MGMTPEGKVRVGDTYGLLTVIRFVGVTPVYRKHVWVALCKCGNEVVVKSQELLIGDTRSCGCLHRAAVVARNKENAKHQLRGSPEYRSWRGAKDRCLNCNSKDWKNYGGRGIRISSEWEHSFTQFFSDMGAKPSPKHSLERKDVNGDYCKENCVWATTREQSNNKRNSHRVVYDGKRRTLTELAADYGLKECTLRVRLFKQKLDIHTALTRPVASRRSHGNTRE